MSQEVMMFIGAGITIAGAVLFLVVAFKTGKKKDGTVSPRKGGVKHAEKELFAQERREQKQSQKDLKRAEKQALADQKREKAEKLERAKNKLFGVNPKKEKQAAPQTEVKKPKPAAPAPAPVVVQPVVVQTATPVMETVSPVMETVSFTASDTVIVTENSTEWTSGDNGNNTVILGGEARQTPPPTVHVQQAIPVQQFTPPPVVPVVPVVPAAPVQQAQAVPVQQFTVPVAPTAPVPPPAPKPVQQAAPVPPATPQFIPNTVMPVSAPPKPAQFTTAPQTGPLSAPDGLRISGTALMWNPVAGATGYKVAVDGIEYASQINYCALPTNLPAGNHTLKVKAVGGGGNTDSVYSEGIQHTEYSRNLVYELSATGKEYYVGDNSENTDTVIAIPPIYNGKPVTKVSEAAFSDCRALTTVIFPAGLTDIDSWAFCGCSALTSVTIPATVSTIGEYAFYESNLLNIYVRGYTCKPVWWSGAWNASNRPVYWNYSK